MILYVFGHAKKVLSHTSNIIVDVPVILLEAVSTSIRDLLWERFHLISLPITYLSI